MEELTAAHRSEGTIHEQWLRDQFAAVALPGILAEEEVLSHDAPIIAEIAYRFADAMLAERKKQPCQP